MEKRQKIKFKKNEMKSTKNCINAKQLKQTKILSVEKEKRKMMMMKKHKNHLREIINF